MKLLFDENPSPRLVLLLGDLFPGSESALRNGLAGAGDRTLPDYATVHNFILVSTDSDFERLLRQIPGAKVVILRSCDYPTDVASEVGQFQGSIDHSGAVGSGRDVVCRMLDNPPHIAAAANERREGRPGRPPQAEGLPHNTGLLR